MNTMYFQSRTALRQNKNPRCKPPSLPACSAKPTGCFCSEEEVLFRRKLRGIDPDRNKYKSGIKYKILSKAVEKSSLLRQPQIYTPPHSTNIIISPKNQKTIELVRKITAFKQVIKGRASIRSNFSAVRVIAVPSGHSNRIDAIAWALRAAKKLHLRDEFIQSNEARWKAFYAGGLSWREDKLKKFAEEAKLKIITLTVGKGDLSELHTYYNKSDNRGTIYLVKINLSGKEYPVHYDAVHFLEETDWPEGCAEIGLPTDLPLDDRLRSVEPASTMHALMKSLYQDVTMQMNVFTSLRPIKRVTSSLDLDDWRLRLARHLRTNTDLLSLSSADPLAFFPTKASPHVLALEGNAVYEWVGHGDEARVAFPIYISNYFDLAPHATPYSSAVDTRQNYVVGIADIASLTRPDIYLKNLALALQNHRKSGDFAGASLIIYGLPPMTFLSWLRQYGHSDRDFKRFEMESPIADIEVVIAVPLPRLSQEEQKKEVNSQFGHFLFPIKASHSPFHLKCDNILSAGIDRNWVSHWEAIRSFILIDEVIKEALRNSSDPDHFWTILSERSQRNRVEIDWEDLRSVRKEAKKKEKELRALATTIEKNKIDLARLKTEIDLYTHEKRPEKDTYPLMALHKKLDTETREQKKLLKHIDPLDGVEKFMLRLKGLVSFCLGRIKADPRFLEGFHLSPEHIIADAIKGFSYSDTHSTLRSMTPDQIESHKYFEVHGVNVNHVIRKSGDRLHIVRGFYLSTSTVPDGRPRLSHLLTGIALFVGRNSKIDITMLASTLATQIVRYNKGSSGIAWIKNGWDRIALGDIVAYKAAFESQFNMDRIHEFQSLLLAKIKAQQAESSQDIESIDALYEQVYRAPFFTASDGTIITVEGFSGFLSRYASSSDTILDGTMLSEMLPPDRACLELIESASDPVLEERGDLDPAMFYFSQLNRFNIEGVAKYIYVVLPDDTVLVSFESTFGDGSRIAHSQLAGGTGVKCAGEIVFRKRGEFWYAEEVNDGSGHYKPPAFAALPHIIQTIQNELSFTDIKIPEGGIAFKCSLLPDLPGVT